MWQPENLADFYQYMALTQSFATFPARFTLLLGLLIVHAGVQKPGQKLLTGVFSGSFFVSFYLATGGRGMVIPLMLLSFALCVAAGYSAYKDEARWVVLPDDERWRAPAIGAYVIAFFFPLWPNIPLFHGILYSPVGILPHQTLAILFILVACTGRGAPRTLVATAFVCGGLLVLMDIIIGSFPPGMLVLASGLAAAVSLYIDRSSTASVRDAGTFGGKDASPAKPEDSATKKPEKKWDIR